MAETKSVTAVLRARDAGFSSVFSKAQGNASKLKTSLGRIAAGIGVYKAASIQFFICILLNPNFSPISRLVFPAALIATISASNALMFPQLPFHEKSLPS